MNQLKFDIPSPNPLPFPSPSLPPEMEIIKLVGYTFLLFLLLYCLSLIYHHLKGKGMGVRKGG
jgi:hypothetical protein